MSNTTPTLACMIGAGIVPKGKSSFIPPGKRNSPENSCSVFKMVSLKTDDNNAILIVQDLLIGNEKNRAIHSSQFLYNLWWYTDKKNLKVEYKDSKGKTRLTAKTTSEICERIGKGEKELSFMAENVDFDNIAFD